jgi:uncharacterized protein
MIKIEFFQMVGTFDSVIKKIELVETVAPDYARKIGICMVIDPMNDFDCINSIYLNYAGLRNLNLVSSLIDYEYINKQIAFSDDYKWRYKYQQFLAILSEFRRFPDEDLSPIAKSIFRPALVFQAKCAYLLMSQVSSSPVSE